jgi:hypothetical protein
MEWGKGTETEAGADAKAKGKAKEDGGNRQGICGKRSGVGEGPAAQGGDELGAIRKRDKRQPFSFPPPHPSSTFSLYFLPFLSPAFFLNS